jgi:hypothetical protein
MRRNQWIPACTCLLAFAPGTASAQIDGVVRAAVLAESYSFDAGLGFESISELSIPVVARFGLDGRGDLLLSTGYANLRSSGAEGAEDVTLSGVLDIEARLTLEVVPKRLSVILSGVLPSGTSTLETEQVPILALISNEALDLTTLRFGSGGAFGGGFVGAVPAGNMALGVAATYRQEMAYDPLAGSSVQLSPGPEMRVRVGLEGQASPTSYLRLAAMFSRRGQDEFGVDSPGAASNQWTGYAALENGLGSSNLALYIFDSFRTAPRLEGTAFGPTVLPRSNTFAVGGQWVVPVRSLDHITPKVEYRLARAAPSPDDDQLEKLGSTFRAGVEYRLNASPLASVVFQAEGLFGEVGDLRAFELVGVTGYRAGIHVELRR